MNDYQGKHQSEVIGLQTSDTGIIKDIERTIATIQELKDKFVNSFQDTGAIKSDIEDLKKYHFKNFQKRKLQIPRLKSNGQI